MCEMFTNKLGLEKALCITLQQDPWKDMVLVTAKRRVKTTKVYPSQNIYMFLFCNSLTINTPYGVGGIQDNCGG